ncbi:MAG: CotH kinase family protein [Actinomycetota bacterium]|nr:CotH kinase family protein [Actinomycetota bacterium]
MDIQGWGQYQLWVTTGQVPVVTIDTAGQDILNFPKIDCNVQLMSDKDWYNYNTPDTESLIEIRGGSSRFSKKKSYSFKFERNLVHNIEVDLMDMIEARKWILNGCFLDRSFMRDKISYDLFNQLRDQDHYDYASQTRFVEVFVNGNYNGLYLLTERIDEDSLHLNNFSPDDPMHSVVYKSYSSATSWRRFNTDINYIPYDKLGPYQGYLQKEPNPDNPDQGEFWSPLAYFREMAIKSPDNYFNQFIGKVLDTANAIDLHLLILVTGTDDALLNNQYLARDNQEDSRFFFVPWDYNASFGRNAYSIKTSFARWYSNGLLDRLFSAGSYSREFKQRWNQVKDSVFSYQNIEQMVDANAELIQDSAERNFNKYPIVVGDNWKNDQYVDAYNFGQELDYIKSWVHDRINFLDAYINATDNLAANMVNEAIRISVDYPQPGENITGDFDLSGWAVNVSSQQGPAIHRVEIYNETGEALNLVTVARLRAATGRCGPIF